MALPAQFRIKKKKEIDTVWKKGKTSRGAFLLLKALPNSHPYNRWAVVVSSRVIPLATQRNRIRRILVEKIQSYRWDVGYDVVCGVRMGAPEKEILRDLQDLHKRHMS